MMTEVDEQPGPPDWSQVDEEITCPMCEYQLRGLSEPRCPECGFRFAWPEVLNRRLRRHPYLFEHHPEAPAWSFLRTVAGSMRPARFWKALFPSQPSRPAGLAVYWVLCLAPSLLTCVAMIFFDAPRPFGAWMVPVRAASPRRWLVSNSLDYTAWDYWTRWMLDEPQVLSIRWLFYMASWAIAVTLTLLVFQVTLRRRRLRWHHVARTAIYSGDIVFLLGTIALLLSAALFIVGQHASEWAASAMLASLPVLWAVASWRTYVAIRDYLRLPQPLLVSLAMQSIILLAFLTTW